MSSITVPPLTSQKIGRLSFLIPDDGSQVHLTGFPSNVKWLSINALIDNTNALSNNDILRLLIDAAPGNLIGALLQMIKNGGGVTTPITNSFFLPMIGQQFETFTFGKTDLYADFVGVGIGNTHTVNVIFGV